MPPSHTGSFLGEEVRAYTSVCHTLDNSSGALGEPGLILDES